jgi:hypothetical protein
MNKINRNKANDIYKIKPTILKDLTTFLSPILTQLFNKSIDENEYPDSLKITKVIELYKAKDWTLPKNYRPISLLPLIAKLLDTLINNQIMTHLTTHNIISPTQYAFRPNSNTTTALQTIFDNLFKYKNAKEPALAIYIDLSKAYDTVSHTKLCTKLKDDFNFDKNTVDFFRSYLRNRQQSTHTQYAQSKTQTITHGIPQGSTLSTTFFLLYINDIIQTVPDSKVYTYADDTTLIITAPDIEKLQTLAQTELSNLIHYFHKNNLVPNPTKTVYSIFYPQTPQNIKLTIGDLSLKHETDSKLLGIKMQNNLKHHHTIIHITKKLQPTIQRLKYANKLLPHHKLREIYFTHVYPHLIGGISLWGTHEPTKTYIQPLVKIQKKIVRLIFRRPPCTHTKPLMKQLKILNITNLYILRVCTEMHPFIYPRRQRNRPEHNHQYIFTSQIHTHRTRYSQQKHAFIPSHTRSKIKPLKYTMEHLTKQYSHLWNTLPQNIRDIHIRTTFKQTLQTHLLNKQNND